MSDRVSITVLPNGPFKVSGATRVEFCGEPVAVEGDVFLCRCGHSGNPPFCDSSHRRVGFEGESPERANKDLSVWEGQTLRTFFNPNTCMHVFYCKPLKELRARELAGDAAAAEQIMAVVASCPSGALSYETKTELAEPARDHAVEIDIIEGGEMRMQCAFDINVPLRERQPNDRATLCRCGLSKSKPWCDGRHKGRDDFR